MVRIWKKEKKESCGGKLIATDFKRLNPKIFYPVHELTKDDLNKALFLCTPDGKMYFNTKREECNLMFSVFEILVKERRDILKELEKQTRKEFPNIKNIDDWVEFVQSANTEAEQERAMRVLGSLMIPTELDRREIEKHYYG